MPRFAANLSMMFTEVDFLDRALSDIADDERRAIERGAERIAQAIGIDIGIAAAR